MQKLPKLMLIATFIIIVFTLALAWRAMQSQGSAPTASQPVEPAKK